MNRRLAIIGSGAFAQQIINIIEDAVEPFEVVGYFDDFVRKGEFVCGYPVLGAIEDLFELYHSNVYDCIFLAIGYKHFSFKETIYNMIKGKIPLANIISKTAFVHPTARIGEGVLLKEFSIINQNAVVEDNVCITLRSIVNHDCFIDKHTFFSTSVTTAGNVHIGKRCFIGVGSIISDGVMITDDVWLSPGSVVGKDLKEPGQYIGYSLKLNKI